MICFHFVLDNFLRHIVIYITKLQFPLIIIKVFSTSIFGAIHLLAYFTTIDTLYNLFSVYSYFASDNKKFFLVNVLLNQVLSIGEKFLACVEIPSFFPLGLQREQCFLKVDKIVLNHQHSYEVGK